MQLTEIAPAQVAAQMMRDLEARSEREMQRKLAAQGFRWGDEDVARSMASADQHTDLEPARASPAAIHATLRELRGDPQKAGALHTE